MRPFVTFIGLVLMIPGWSLVTTGPSDIMDPHFSTESGTFLWTLLGNPHDIGLIHRYGLVTIILGITIVIYGLLATPEEKETTASLTQ